MPDSIIDRAQQTPASGEMLLEGLGLGIARLVICASDPTMIDVIYYGGSEATTRPVAETVSRRFRCDQAVRFPGNVTLPDADLQLAVTRSSDFSVAIAVHRGGVLLAQALGLTDRDNPDALMTAWWTGQAEPYGVVKYSVRDEQTVAGYYISKMTPEAPGEDIAIGDTRGGLPGDYVLNSQEVSGRTWGPHEWKLTKRDAIFDLAWREHGRTFCRGIGMPDPDDSASFIATYIALP